MNDDLQILRFVQPDVEPLDPSAFTERRAELMALIAQDGQDAHLVAPARVRRSRRRWILPAVAFGVLGATAAGWAAVVRDPTQTMSLSCGGQMFIDATSGDPLADCTAAWRDATDGEPPPLVAYRDEVGGVSVQPEGVTVPAGWQRLDAGFRQDGRLIELRSSLDDVGEGVESGCLGFDRARMIAERELARLALTGWVVLPEHGLADGTESCATPIVQPELFRVLLVARVPAQGMGDQKAPLRPMAQRLHARLRDTCVTLDRAAEIARQEAATLAGQGVPSDAFTVTTITVAGATCTSATVTASGTIRITLRGPSGG